MDTAIPIRACLFGSVRRVVGRALPLVRPCCIISGYLNQYKDTHDWMIQKMGSGNGK